jgi:hypothetical protein
MRGSNSAKEANVDPNVLRSDLGEMRHTLFRATIVDSH